MSSQRALGEPAGPACPPAAPAAPGATTVRVPRLQAGSLADTASSDVGRARERARQVRLKRLAAWLLPVAALLWWRLLAGHPVRFWPIALPAGLGPYVPAIVLVGLLGAMLAGPLLLAGRSPHVLYRPGDTGIGLADVVGCEAVVSEVVRTLNLFLAHKSFAEAMGGTPRRGLLFEGPPGTGKTYLAKAMAAEAGVPFLFVSSSAFQSMYYGQTNRKIRSYFKALRRAAKASGGAIGFIEEIDAIGASRAGMGGTSGREGISGVVNELLVQMQSFEQPTASERLAARLAEAANALLPAGRRLSTRRPTPANVLIVGATNRAADLDAALVRAGRFDRTITFDLPSRNSRREIIDYYLTRKAHDAGLDAGRARDDIAGATFGYSPVDIERLLNEALVFALRRGAAGMSVEDVSRAKSFTELGVEQPVSYTPDERRRIALHESGHATLAWACGGEAKLRRLDVLSIVKRGSSLGLLAHSPSEERFTATRGELFDSVTISLAGMVAEELFLGEASSGAGSDLQAATATVARMVGAFGMGEGLASYAEAGPTNAGLVAKVLASDECRRVAESTLSEARERARAILEARRGVVEALTAELLAKDELVGGEIEAVIAAAADEEVIDLTRAPSAQAGRAWPAGAGVPR
ncbi:MAG: AAA family ATPase [Acidimicrobiales bacterium]